MKTKKKNEAKTLKNHKQTTKKAAINEPIHTTPVPASSKISPSNGLFVIVLILVIMSAIQVFQTQQLLNAVSSGTLKIGTPSQGSSVGLPSQVGGC